MRTSDVEEDKRNGVSATQKRGPEPLSEEVRAKKKTSIPITSDRTDDKGGPDKNTKTSNKNLTQGKQTDDVHTSTSYFDPVWTVFSKHTDGSLQWIPKQIVDMSHDMSSHEPCV